MKKNIPVFAFVASILFASFISFHPAKTICGKITDSKNKPIANADVNILLSSVNGTYSDAAGIFHLSVNDSAKNIIVSAVGFETKIISLPVYDDTLRIVLREIMENADSLKLSSINHIEMKDDGFKKSTICSGTSGLISGATTTYMWSPVSGSATSPAPVTTLTITDYSVKGDRPADLVDYDVDGVVSSYDEVTTDIPGESGGSYSSPSSSYNSSLTNKLTAGEINDFSKWTLWKDIEETTLKDYKQQWLIKPEIRYSVQLETDYGMPVINAEVELVDKSKNILWTSKTDNTGKAELWTNMFVNVNDSKNLNINIKASGKDFVIENAKEFHNGINIKKIPVDCNVNDAVDIAFVVDATGSMQDEIDYLKAELDNIIYKVKDSLPKTDLNVGCVFYRDNVDAFLTKKSDLTADLKTTIDFIGTTAADGGGDFPEAVDAGLKTAINDLKWRDDASARIIFLVLDAPPHQTAESRAELQKQIELAAKKGIRIVPVACSGVDKSTEYLMRSFALATNGTYIFLNDKSGIGGSHIEPTTDSYKTEFLNGIIYRTICNFSHTTSCTLPSQVENTVADTMTVYNPLLQNVKLDTAKKGGDTSQIINSKIASDTSTTLTNWKYFPNPTMGKVHVSIEGNIDEFFVTDISGKILQRIAAKKLHEFDIDLTDFSAGIYFIAYEYTPGKMMTGKLVLVH